jgi:hypothetical protein
VAEPIAFFAVVTIGVIGLYLAFAVPIFFRWKAGDNFVPGNRSLGPKYKWWAPLGERLRVEVRQLHDSRRARRTDHPLDLLARVGEELVHRTEAHDRSAARASRRRGVTRNSRYARGGGTRAYRVFAVRLRDREGVVVGVDREIAAAGRCDVQLQQRRDAGRHSRE